MQRSLCQQNFCTLPRNFRNWRRLCHAVDSGVWTQPGQTGLRRDVWSAEILGFYDEPPPAIGVTRGRRHLACGRPPRALHLVGEFSTIVIEVTRLAVLSVYATPGTRWSRIETHTHRRYRSSHTRTRTRAHTHIRTNTLTHTHTPTSACAYTRIHLHVHAHKRKHISRSTRTHAHCTKIRTRPHYVHNTQHNTHNRPKRSLYYKAYFV